MDVTVVEREKETKLRYLHDSGGRYFGKTTSYMFPCTHESAASTTRNKRGRQLIFYILKKLEKIQIFEDNSHVPGYYILKQLKLKQQPTGHFPALASDASFVEGEPHAHPVAVQVHSAILLQEIEKRNHVNYRKMIINIRTEMLTRTTLLVALLGQRSVNVYVPSSVYFCSRSL